MAVASPSVAAGFDTCLVGSWKVTAHKLTGAIQQYTGGTGATLNVSADGTATINFAGSLPAITVVYAGQGPSQSTSVKGSATMTMHTASGKLTGTDTGGDVTVIATIDGVVQHVPPYTFFVAAYMPYGYTCSTSTLTITITSSGVLVTDTVVTATQIYTRF